MIKFCWLEEARIREKYYSKIVSMTKPQSNEKQCLPKLIHWTKFGTITSCTPILITSFTAVTCDDDDVLDDAHTRTVKGRNIIISNAYHIIHSKTPTVNIHARIAHIIILFWQRTKKNETASSRLSQ